MDFSTYTHDVFAGVFGLSMLRGSMFDRKGEYKELLKGRGSKKGTTMKRKQKLWSPKGFPL